MLFLKNGLHLACLSVILMSAAKTCCNEDHTSRGSSGALYLKSAIAGVDSYFEGSIRVVCAAADCVEEWVLRDRRL